MNNIALYCLTVLIWGTTWFAIKLQIGHAPDEVSILYRAILAAIGLVVWCRLKGLSLRFKGRDHIYLCLLGMAMFSLHYLFVYHATHHLVSGFIAVVFSCVSFLSILNNYIFFKIKPKLNIILCAFIGIVGLCVLFWHEVTDVTLQKETITGLILAGIGAVIFSLGSSISKRNNNHSMPIIPAMTIGMIYGAIVMILYTLFSGTHLVFPENVIYWSSLLYLVVPGSIIAFLCYLKLIKNMGPDIAGYTTVLFPLVALIISWMLECYELGVADLLGLILVISGNVLVMKKANRKNAT